MKIALNRKSFFILSVEFIGLIITALYLLSTFEDQSQTAFLRLSQLGTVICAFYTLLLCVQQKSIFNIVVLLFISFWAFQFGLPVCYAILDNYSNFYINLFNTQILVNGCQYTIIAIEVFAFSLSIMYERGKSKANKVVFDDRAWTRNNRYVSNVGLAVFMVTAIIEIPLVAYAAYQTKALGFFAANTRSLLSSNAVFRAIQAFCVPAGLLTIIYSESKYREKIITALIILISILQLVAGDRTNGLASLLAIAYYKVFGKTENRKKIGKQIGFAFVLGILLLILVYVAVARVSTDSVSIGEILSRGIIGSFFAELGLNFTTICFVMDYIPSTYGLRYGATYVSAFLCLIPKSLDPTGFINFLSSYNPEMWLYNANHSVYGTLLDYGVGFSTIGESYMNFGWFGIVAVFFIGIIIMKFLNVEFSKCSDWQKYIQLVLLISLMTFARRGFYDLLKDIEYGVFGMALILFAFSSHKGRGK